MISRRRTEHALAADSPGAGFFGKLRGRAAEAQRSALSLIMERTLTYNRLILGVTLTAFVNMSIAFGQLGPPRWTVSRSCLTEIRGGKKSCWGIVIDFDHAQFKNRISADQIKVFEAKHGTNLINLMTWRVSRDGKRLTIKFKPGTGDFGTGNRAEITLYKTAFAVPPKDFPYYVIFVQVTDLN